MSECEVYEMDSPFIIITDKLKNIIYHVNDTPESIMTKATTNTPSPLSN